MPKKVIVIGAGFAGLSAASYLGKFGYDVQVLEKNDSYGGRARVWMQDGFSFDMGPSWYWMPDVFEKFFADFEQGVSTHYNLQRLEPSYRVFFGIGDFLDVPAHIDSLKALFESIEPGAAKNLGRFLKDAEYKYKIGMQEMVYKPGISISELIDLRIARGIFKIHLLKSHASLVGRYFKHPKIRKILEFPVLFLGATPQNTPALYSLMNYADLELGTWYPMGGMYKIIDAFVNVAERNNVAINCGVDVEKIKHDQKTATVVSTNKGDYEADIVVTTADYHFTETILLDKGVRNYSDKYWSSRTLAPSCLIFYLGLNKKIDGLKHHNLFFDREFTQHARQIYDFPSWPDDPLFYVCSPSKTDSSVVPESMENLFLLMPIAPGIQDNDDIRERYFDILLKRLEAHLGVSVAEHIVLKRSYSINNFKADYNSYKGNAYGLANTLRQTANLKPGIRSKKINNLFYAGQFTVPGPGVPPSIISGNIVAHYINKKFNP